MIEFKNITKSFGDRNILDDISYHVKKAETFVIIGSSGMGKSVSLKHMIGLLSPSSGQILIDGEDFTAMDARAKLATTKKFGVLFQSGALLAWMTIYDNIALPLREMKKFNADEIDAKVQEVLKEVELQGSEHKFPSEISGGMRKRAGLARAIVTEPQVILYDEPTSGLDPVMSRTIDQLILKLQKKLGVTSVVVTHDLHSAFGIADRVAMLYNGKFIEINTPKEFVKSKNPMVQEFIKAQFAHGNIEGIQS